MAGRRGGGLKAGEKGEGSERGVAGGRGVRGQGTWGREGCWR